jgi:membrane protein implicated in regulation of membrane protease activity
MTAGSGPVFVVNRGAVVTGVALVSVGGLLLTAGAAITTVALLQATRRWVAKLETPPSELARRQLAHAKAATSAGVNAWRSPS